MEEREESKIGGCERRERSKTRKIKLEISEEESKEEREGGFKGEREVRRAREEREKKTGERERKKGRKMREIK